MREHGHVNPPPPSPHPQTLVASAAREIHSKRTCEGVVPHRCPPQPFRHARPKSQAATGGVRCNCTAGPSLQPGRLTLAHARTLRHGGIRSVRDLSHCDHEPNKLKQIHCVVVRCAVLGNCHTTTTSHTIGHWSTPRVLSSGIGRQRLHPLRQGVQNAFEDRAVA